MDLKKYGKEFELIICSLLRAFELGTKNPEPYEPRVFVFLKDHLNLRLHLIEDRGEPGDGSADIGEVCRDNHAIG